MQTEEAEEAGEAGTELTWATRGLTKEKLFVEILKNTK